MTAPHPDDSVMNIRQAMAYTGKGREALKTLRYKKKGPRSFLLDGRISYYKRDLDAWMTGAARADSHWNQALDPTRQEPEPRRGRPRNKRPAKPAKYATDDTSVAQNPAA